jgi:hypothetical protein
MLKFIATAVSMGVMLSACSTYSPAPRPPARPVAAAPAARIVLTTEHVAIIHAYYGRATPGRGRASGGLPPGIAKNLGRGRTLPPGITKQHLPNSVLRELPAAPSGLEYVVMAGKLLLVEAATQVVREVLLESVFG